MGVLKQGEAAEKFIQEHREKMRERLQAQRAELSDEIRRCTRCSWQERKSVCIAMGIRACPQCGNTQCVGLSIDCAPEMLDPRKWKREGS